MLDEARAEIAEEGFAVRFLALQFHGFASMSHLERMGRSGQKGPEWKLRPDIILENN